MISSSQERPDNELCTHLRRVRRGLHLPAPTAAGCIQVWANDFTLEGLQGHVPADKTALRGFPPTVSDGSADDPGGM